MVRHDLLRKRRQSLRRVFQRVFGHPTTHLRALEGTGPRDVRVGSVSLNENKAHTQAKCSRADASNGSCEHRYRVTEHQVDVVRAIRDHDGQHGVRQVAQHTTRVPRVLRAQQHHWEACEAPTTPPPADLGAVGEDDVRGVGDAFAAQANTRPLGPGSARE